MVRITEGEFFKNPSHIQHLAFTEPVTVTANGHERTVILPAEEYHRLKRRDRLVMTLDDFTNEDIEALKKARAPEDTKQFNHEVPD
jgi:PHD/YefM family antitoxin component YafN of YafNO toxin-antitoxin module